MKDFRHSFTGKKIPYVTINPNMDVSELIELYSSAGYNARKLGEAADLFYRMIDDDATICLTISGAMTPIGYGGLVKELIKRGFVDWIISTGANIYHEDHFAWDLPVKQGHHQVDDDLLHNKDIVRIYDVFIKGEGTLQEQDKVLQEAFKHEMEGMGFTTAEFSRVIGKHVKKSKFPERSFIATAYDYDVPVYISTLKDSSLALDLIPLRFHGREFLLDFVREIAEQAAIVYNSEKSGALEIGGGVPKNTVQQTGPALDQILRVSHGGLNYIIQLTDARPDTGGLSGATLQEGKSWGKVKSSHENLVTVYGDASISFPLLCAYAISKHETRKPKRLYTKLGDYYKKLKDISQLDIQQRNVEGTISK
ncbi:MAG: deoxyhypusine synthase [Thaumarchaeota archaeon]|nr:deoxyhypusine synthase [Nitrososphaerota archaeon]